jgi:hypothetical protein
MKTEGTKNEKDQLPTGITKEMIDGWKEKYGDDMIRLKTLYRDNSIEPVYTVTRVPSRPIVNEFMKLIDKNFDKAMGILVANCCLHNVEEIKKDPELFLTCGKAIADDLPIGRAESKKL